MMLANLLLPLALLAPQDPQNGDARLTSVLKASEIKKLNTRLQKWVGAEASYQAEPNAQRRMRLNASVGKAKDAFMREWTKVESKEPLKHLGDLLAVFDNAFAYDRQTGTGEMKIIKPRGGQEFFAAVPRGYKDDQSYPCVLVIPGRGDGAWTDNKDYYGEVWKGNEFAASSLFVSPSLDDGLELDYLGDLTTDSGDAQEKARIGAVLGAAGEAQRLLNIDRNRLILDCGVGSCAFGLRLATYFPARFGGIILRDPQLNEGIRLDSLKGMSVLIVTDAAGKENAEKVKSKLDEFQKGACTIIEGKGAAPYVESGAEIAAWAKNAKRDLFRKEIRLAPNHDLFRKAYWVTVGVAKSAFGPEEDRPFLEASADRDANRITITAKNIEQISLFLNDAIVDLDKEFTIVLNGKAITETRSRSFVDMWDWMNKRFDPTFIFTTSYTTDVPETEQ